jgi:hypothetical protein
MMGIETIRNISDVAAYRAAEEGREPLSIWAAKDATHIPFLGDYTPAGWRRALWSDFYETPRVGYPWREDEEAYFMVDSSGFGSLGEPALTAGEFGAFVTKRQRPSLVYGWAIREAGQFQVVVGAYIRDESSPGNPAPDESEVECSECSTVHDDMEECDEYGLQDNCGHVNVSDEDTYPDGITFGALPVRVIVCDDCGADLVPEPDDDGVVRFVIDR